MAATEGIRPCWGSLLRVDGQIVVGGFRNAGEFTVEPPAPPDGSSVRDVFGNPQWWKAVAGGHGDYTVMTERPETNEGGAMTDVRPEPDVRVSDAILKAHGLRSLGERPTPEKLLEMADAFRAAAYDALNGETDA